MAHALAVAHAVAVAKGQSRGSGNGSGSGPRGGSGSGRGENGVPSSHDLPPDPLSDPDVDGEENNSDNEDERRET